MNAEQASKRESRKPTRLVFRGRPSSLDKIATASNGSAGVVASACMEEEIDRNTGSPSGGGRDPQPDSGDGQAGPRGVAERPVVVMKPGNAGGAKGP